MNWRAVRDRLDKIAASPWFAYGSILLIQARVLWGIWLHRDLPAGDSSDHFERAARWSDHLQLDALVSPLYSVFWGTLDWLIGDTYAAAIVQRVVIVIAVSLLVLAVLRRLLSPAIAWAIAAWWALLPVVYDTVTEVHLFVMMPLLLAVLVALRWSGRPMRAAVFGILLGTAVLVRNELVIAAAIWGLACVAYELRGFLSQGRGFDWRSILRGAAPYGAAALVIAALAIVAMLRFPGEIRLEGWRGYASSKQSFALCQHYAVGYEQRTEGMIFDGWTACDAFMERDFGSPRPSLMEAFAADPRALAAHFGWNAQLAPYGLQEALFDRTSGSGSKNPDYVPTTTGSSLALLASLAVLALLGSGLVLLWRRRERFWRTWIQARVWGWLALGCLAVTGICVAITTHPRPAYLFPLSFAILCLTGMCAMALAERWPGLSRLRWAVPLMAALLIALVPSHYPAGYQTEFTGSDRQLKEMVSRLEPYGDRLRGAGTTLLAPLARDVCNYVGRGEPCTAAPPDALAGVVDSDAAGRLKGLGIDYLYADERTVVSGQALFKDLERAGWRPLAPAARDRDWVLLASPGASASTQAAD